MQNQQKYFAQAILILLALIALYFVGYYATVQQGVFFHHGILNTFPGYWFGWDDGDGTINELANSFFSPAHSVDRRLRPNHWSDGRVEDFPAQDQPAPETPP